MLEIRTLSAQLTTFIPFRQLQIDNDNMPPKKKVERPAQENISLGPQVREGQLPGFPLRRAPPTSLAPPSLLQPHSALRILTLS